MRARLKDKLWLAGLPLAALLVSVGHAACTYSISPPNRTHGPGATTNTVDVTAGVGCAWAVDNPNAWITILSAASGTGNSTVTYAVTANPNPLERTGVVMIATNVFTIRQSALTCSVSASPPSRTHGPGANAHFFTVNLNGAGCPWSVSNTNGWISIVSPTNGLGSSTVDYTFTANPGFEWRTGVVMVVTQSFTLIQQGIACAYDVSPSMRSHGHSGATDDFAVTATPGCGWVVVKTNAWITIHSGGSGTGTGLVTYSVSPNPTGLARSGSLTVSNRVITLTQSGAPCTYSIAPTNAAYGEGSATGLVAVTALPGCSWAAVSTNGWITIDSGASGVGNGSVGYTVAANPGPGARSGSFAIDGLSFNVSQPAPACYYKVTPATRGHGSSAVSNFFTITVAPECAWSIVNTSSWIIVRSATSGFGNATNDYAVEANPSANSRVGVIVVNGATLTITQQGNNCVAMSPTMRSHGRGATNNSVNVTAMAGCSWTAVTTNAWITITAGATGTGNGVINYAIEANPSGVSRVGSIAIADEVFTITQDPSPCSYSITPADRNHGHGAASNGLSVTATPDCPWPVVKTNDWITIVTGANGVGNGTVGYTVSANPSTNARAGTLVIQGQVFSITQGGAPCSYALLPTEAVHGFHLETGMVTVAAIGGCAWAVINTNNWVGITSGANGAGDGTVGYALATNPGGSPRTGYLTIGGESFRVTQAAMSCNYRLSPTNRTHGYSGSANSVTLTVSNGCGWNVVNTNGWITITTPTTGSGSATISYAVAQNSNPASRSGVVLIGGQPFTVSQNAANCDISVSPLGRMHGPGLASNAVTVTDNAGCGWSVLNTNGWLSFLTMSGSGNLAVGYTVAGNTTAVERAGIVIIGGENFSITQQAANCSISLSPVSRAHGPGTASNAVVITDAAACGWSVVNTNGWINFLAAAGSGNTTLGYTVAANSTLNERTGVVLINGQSFTLTQQMASCMVSIAPADRSHGAGAATNSITVTDAANCGWTVVNTSYWVTITSALSGTGNGTVAYIVEPNQGLTPRSTTLRIGDETFLLSQAGFICTYRVSPTTRTHGFLAATNTFAVTTTTNCAWTVANTNTWVTLHSGGSGSGTGLVTYSVSPNLSTNLRSGFLVVGDAMLSLSQRGATNGFSFDVIAIQDGTQVRLRLVGAPTGVWELQGSLNLQTWTRLGDVTNTTGSVEFNDPTPATLNHRFYRAVLR